MSLVNNKEYLEKQAHKTDEFIKELEQDKSIPKLGTNPKDLIGSKKVSISKLPPAGIIHGAHGMMNGAQKYGPYNWRGNSVIASIYIDAIMRHTLAFLDGEDLAEDSGVKHLGHVIACASILLDAEATGNLIDDRPKGGKAADILAKLNAQLKKEAERG